MKTDVQGSKEPIHSEAPSLDRIREAHKADEAYISACIERSDVEHLSVSKGVFAHGFEELSPQERRDRIKARVKAQSFA